MDGRKGTRVARALLAVLLLGVAFMQLPAGAFAASGQPTGEFQQFDECPLARETITDCVFAVSNGGVIEVGDREIALVQPITLQGGFEGSGNVDFFGAAHGDTLSAMAQPVPGGLWAATALPWWPKWLQGSFKQLYDEELTGLTATIELAAPATSITLNTGNLLFEKGTALGLPVRLKLSNAILGNHCYVGSSSKPVMLEMTTGRSGGLVGSAGKLSNGKEFTLLTLSNGKFVDGTFSAPRAEGCGGIFSSFIDPMVDSLFGLPRGSGENTATLEGTFQDAAASAVRESE